MRNMPLAALIFAIIIVLAADTLALSKLEIGRIEISNSDRTIITTSSNTGSFEVDPGDTLRIEVKLENNYPDSSDNDITDVSVYAEMRGMDDGDESDSENVDVIAGSTRTVKLRIEIPDDASSYRSYDLVISAEGRDANGTMHSDDAVFDVEIKRKENELVFNTLQVSDATCGRDAELRIELENIGEEEEQDISLVVTNNEAGTVFRDTFDLSSINDGEEDSIYETTEGISTDDMSTGTQTLYVRVTYDNGKKSLDRTITFQAEGCRETAPVTDTTGSTKRTEQTTERYSNPNRDVNWIYGEETIVVDAPLPGMPVPSPPRVAEPKESGFSLAVLALANLAIIVFIALLIKARYD
jgi:hypothetical protein